MKPNDSFKMPPMLLNLSKFIDDTLVGCLWFSHPGYELKQYHPLALVLSEDGQSKKLEKKKDKGANHKRDAPVISSTPQKNDKNTELARVRLAPSPTCCFLR